MLNLLLLPTELLEQVFHYLGSIDDVHHLGRVCKANYHVIRRLSVYTGIMRAVIGTSVQHRFDVALCKMLDLHRLVVQHFAEGYGPLLATLPVSGAVHHQFENGLALAFAIDPHGPCIECLPDARVHEILARYQGLRALQDIWIARELTNLDLTTADCNINPTAFRQKYNNVHKREDEFCDGEGSARLSPGSETYTKFNVNQRNHFYAAVTCVWLLNEVRWILTQFEYPATSFVVQVKLLTACKQWINSQTATPLLDDLDRHAVFQFMYHHLLPTYGLFLADRSSSKLPLTFDSPPGWDPPTFSKSLQLFLAAGQAYLQPPDLINLVVRSRTSRKRPYPRLLVPESSSHCQHPSPLSHFRPAVETYQHHRVRVLSLIARASINQTEQHLQSHRIVQPSPGTVYKLVDDSAAYLEKKVMLGYRSSMFSTAQLEDWRREWGETWWRVWWWANSEEKARAKMKRWDRVFMAANQ